MVGQVLGSVGGLPEVYTELEISFFLLRRLLGVRTEGDKKAAKVQKLSKNEVLMVNIGSLSTGGRVTAVKADLAKISLTQPVCTEASPYAYALHRGITYFLLFLNIYPLVCMGFAPWRLATRCKFLTLILIIPNSVLHVARRKDCP